MNTFLNSQFGYCPLLWMFHSRKLNECINRIQEKALRLVYKDKTSTYQELLRLDNSVTIHLRYLQILATEIFKWKRNLSPHHIFKTNKTKYSLRNYTNRAVGRVKTTAYGTETVIHRAPLTWQLVPDHMKDFKNLLDVKQKRKTWIPEECECNLCKQYIPGVGYRKDVNAIYVNNTYLELDTYNV